MAQGPVAGYQGGALAANLELVDGPSGQKLVLFYNDTGSALTNGAIKMLSFEVDATDTAAPIIKPILKAPATKDQQMICVVDNSLLALGTVANGAWGYACVGGYVKALCNGTTDIVIGDQLEVLNAGTAFVVGASASAGDAGTIVPEAAAIALEAYTTAADALKMVSLIGKLWSVNIQGS